MSDQPTGVELNAKQAIWYILTSIFPLLITVDGVESRGAWGSQVLNLAPGSHNITVCWKAYWFLPVQKGTLDVSVEPGQVVAVQYKVRWFFLLPGKLFVAPVAPAA